MEPTVATRRVNHEIPTDGGVYTATAISGVFTLQFGTGADVEHCFRAIVAGGDWDDKIWLVLVNRSREIPQVGQRVRVRFRRRPYFQAGEHERPEELPGQSRFEVLEIIRPVEAS
jgi:hypothetical protein